MFDPIDLLQPLFFLTNPSYRVFWGYLVASALLATLVLLINKKSVKNGLQYLCSREFWLNPSVLLDIKLIFFNHWIWLIFLAPLLLSQVSVALFINRQLNALFGQGNFIPGDTWIISVIFSIVIFIIDDFSRFLLHLAYHRIPILWRFHAIHHSATLLTPLTLYRVHIVEVLINNTRRVLVFGIIGGIFIYCVAGSFSRIEVLGASIFSLVFNLAGANLRHSHVWLGWGKFEKWIMSPAQHQIHHSAKPEHFNKNFGVMIGLWDYWFSSWVGSSRQTVTHVGLGKPVKQSLVSSLAGIR